MPYALLGQQKQATPYSLLQDSSTTADSILGRIAEQPLYTKFDPASGITTQSTLGEASQSIFRAFVSEPLGDLKAMAEVVLDQLGDAASFTAEKQALELPFDAAEPDPEVVRRGRRGMALTLGALVAGPAGSTVRSVGARTLLKSPMMQRAPRMLEGMVRLGSGAAEGAAFGGAFGSLRPLDDAEDSRGQAVAYDMLGGALMMTLFSGIGAIRSATARPYSMSVEQNAFLGQTLREATKDDAAAILAGRMERAQMLPEALEIEEVVARVAAGATEQGATKQGLLARMSAAGREVADVVSIRFPQLKKMDPELHTAALAVADASTTGAWLGRRAAQFVEHGLDVEQKSLLWRGLIASRGRQIRQNLQKQAMELEDGSTISINGKHYDAEALIRLADEVAIPDLTAMEQVAFSTNPVVVQAKQRYAEQVLPLITDIRTRNGLTSLVSPDEPFVPLVRATTEDTKRGVRTTLTAERTTGRAKTTPGAEMAFGQASEYVAEGETILSETMRREVSIDRKNEFLYRITAAPWAKKLGNKEAGPKTILHNGEEVPAAVIRVYGNPRVLNDRFVTGVSQVQDVPFDQTLRPRVKPTEQLQSPVEDIIGLRGPELEPLYNPNLGVTNTGNSLSNSARFTTESGLEAPKPPILYPRLNEVTGWNPNDLTFIPKTRKADDLNEILNNATLPAQVAEENSPLIMSLEGILDDAIPGEVVQDLLGHYSVPQSVARAFDELFNTQHGRNQRRIFETDSAIMRGVEKFMDINVGLLLASPVEVTAHSSRILSILSRFPGIGDDQGALQRIANRFIPWFGPKLGGLRSIYNLYDNPKAMLMEARLSRVPGALPSRAFEGEHQGGIGSILPPRAAKVLEGGRKFIFDLPEQSKGLHGFDIRARISAAMMAERIAGRKLTDAELSEYLTQFGTYSEGIQSNLANFLRRTRLNPFAGGQAGIIPAEIRGFFGGSNLPASVRNELSKATQAKLAAETLWRGTVGTVTMMVAVQKALTDRYPWENEPGHKEDLMVGYTEDGRGVYVPFHTLAPDLARAARITGARAVAENLGLEALPVAMRDLTNTVITYGSGGPGTSAAWTLMTGNAPFVTGEGTMLQVVPPQPTAVHTLKARFLTAAGSANPTMENALGVGTAGNVPGFVRIINAVTPGMEVGRQPLLRVSAELRGDKAQFYGVTEERVSRAYRDGMSQSERIRFYRDEALKFPLEQRVMALRQMILQDQQKRKSTLRNAAEAIVGGARPF